MHCQHLVFHIIFRLLGTSRSGHIIIHSPWVGANFTVLQHGFKMLSWIRHVTVAGHIGWALTASKSAWLAHFTQLKRVFWSSALLATQTLLSLCRSLLDLTLIRSNVTLWSCKCPLILLLLSKDLVHVLIFRVKWKWLGLIDKHIGVRIDLLIAKNLHHRVARRHLAHHYNKSTWFMS